MKNNKYTDRFYYSMKEVQLQLDRNFNPEKWQKVVEYRKMYSFELPVFFNSTRKMHLIQTPWILQKEIKMMTKISNAQQEMLSELSKKYSSSTILGDIALKTSVSDIMRILNKNMMKMTRTILESVVNHQSDAIEKEEKKALKFYDEIQYISNKITPPREIAKRFFNIKDFVITNENTSIEDIELIHNSIMETVKYERINSLLTKTATIIFSIVQNQMFGDSSWEVAVLSAMSFLRNTFLKDILQGVSFFSIFDNKKAEIMNAISQGVDDNGDLTYLYFIILNILVETTELSKEQITKYVSNEEKYNSLSIRDKSLNVKTIMRDNPKLTKKQAKFYVNHMNKGAAYTLSDFQKYVGSSYETSRYSMDGLVELGFYKKEKIGKKYVYKPKGK